MIDVIKTLSGIPPLSRSRFIALSAITIINAGILVNDTKAASKQAAKVYGNLNNGGMWRTVQKQARKVLKTAEANGLTIERPYLIRENRIWTVDSSGDLFPV